MEAIYAQLEGFIVGVVCAGLLGGLAYLAFFRK